jgi:hypothetical protein
MKKIFPLWFNFILAVVLIGLAMGCHEEGVRPIIQYSLNGFAAGVGFIAIVRIFIEAP